MLSVVGIFWSLPHASQAVARLHAMGIDDSKINLLTDGNSTENYDNYILKDGEKMILKIED